MTEQGECQPQWATPDHMRQPDGATDVGAWEKDNLCGICPYRQAIQARVEALEAELRETGRELLWTEGELEKAEAKLARLAEALRHLYSSWRHESDCMIFLPSGVCTCEPVEMPAFVKEALSPAPEDGLRAERAEAEREGRGEYHAEGLDERGIYGGKGYPEGERAVNRAGGTCPDVNCSRRYGHAGRHYDQRDGQWWG